MKACLTLWLFVEFIVHNEHNDNNEIHPALVFFTLLICLLLSVVMIALYHYWVYLNSTHYLGLVVVSILTAFFSISYMIMFLNTRKGLPFLVIIVDTAISLCFCIYYINLFGNLQK